MSPRTLCGLLALLLTAACSAAGEGSAPAARQQGGAVGWRPVPGIEPPTLRLGPAAGEQRCLRVVQVVDAAAACSAAECVAAFPSRRVKGLAVGQRAILAEPCEPGPAGSRPFLLWGSTSVLVLQPERSGAGLWSGLARGAESVVRLETEGSVGTLSWSGAGFQWRESPN